MKIVILCGGQGMRLREETEVKPKPMVQIGGMPILWHIMKTYAHYGFNEFVLCLGYKGEVIREFFCNYEIIANDFTLELGKKEIKVNQKHGEEGWKISLVDTGDKAMTGARIKRIASYIDGNTFMLTYGDGVIDLDIRKLLEFHNSHKKIGTVTGVFPPSHYGELVIEGDHVLAFDEKPKNTNSISGGYFVFNKKIFDYISDDENCVFERESLQSLAKDGELKVFKHDGFWQCMDTYRDFSYLNELWKKNQAPWVKWQTKKPLLVK